MTQQEIQDRNEQIALMLGLKKGWWIHQQKPLTDDKKQWWDIEGKTFLGTRVYYIKDLQFHSDWNWLMEAVEFIESKGYEIGIFANRVEIITTIEENRVYETGGKTKKEAVFIAVSDFARQFNLYKL